MAILIGGHLQDIDGDCWPGCPGCKKKEMEMAKITKASLLQEAKELRDRADAVDASLNPSASPSSEEWVSPERHIYVRGKANELRQQASALEARAAHIR